MASKRAKRDVEKQCDTASVPLSSKTSGDRFSVIKTKTPEPADSHQTNTTPDIVIEHQTTSLTENGSMEETWASPLSRASSSQQRTVLFSNKMDLYGDGDSEDHTVQRYLRDYTQPSFGTKEGEEPTEKANLGVILGVFMPCLQNIFGVIYFVRLYWIVGEAGSVEAFFIVFSCCCVSLLTSLSISAIATNGQVTGGGTYFMISRSLGPEFGGAVGILFYLGISVSVAMYLAGSIELMLEYITPELNIFTDKYNNARLYGTVLLLLVSAAVFTGVKFVSRVAMVVLSAVLVAILSVYVGMFVASPENSIKVCFMGDRLLISKNLMVNGTLQCNKDPDGPLHHMMCHNGTGCSSVFLESEVQLRPAIPGLSVDNFVANAYNRYGEAGQLIGTHEAAETTEGQITRDITTSFVVLMAIYFPSITGFEQGSSYSGDLADAQNSIPHGTLWAVAVTSFVCTVDGSVLRDKFGASISRQLILSQLSWPNPWVILIGALMSTVGAGLQALTAAPRLLQAIAKDNVFPILEPFTYMTRKGEPIPAIGLSLAIAEVGILIANLDYVAPIVTMFFLLCYGFVNFACALQSMLRSPHWRPRFRFYHWSLALLGVALCLSLMILSSWYYTLIALALASSVYKYVEYKGAEKEWGDGMRGLAMSAARYALLRLKEDVFEGSTKNWRPQLLVLTKLSSTLQPVNNRVLSLASQLKAGRGLTIVGSVMSGDFVEYFEESREARYNLMNAMETEQVKGFANVVVSENISQGLCHVIQSAGLGALRPNTVMVCWPDHWFDSTNRKTYQSFMDTLYYAQTANMALQVVKGTTGFPDNSDRLQGTIDIWWIMNDGSMLIMLAFLLVQHKVWKNCELRIFTVAQLEDNSVQIKKDLIQYMYNLRIPATVEVVELEDRHISAYIYERTLKMEERSRLLSAMHLKRKESARVVDTLVDRAHRASLVGGGVTSTRSDPTVKCSNVDQIHIDMDDRRRHSSEGYNAYNVHYTFSPDIGSRLGSTEAADKPHVKDTFQDGQRSNSVDAGKETKLGYTEDDASSGVSDKEGQPLLSPQPSAGHPDKLSVSPLEDKPSASTKVTKLSKSAPDFMPTARPTDSKPSTGPPSDNLSTGPVQSQPLSCPVLSQPSTGPAKNKPSDSPSKSKSSGGPSKNKPSSGPGKNKASPASAKSKPLSSAPDDKRKLLSSEKEKLSASATGGKTLDSSPGSKTSLGQRDSRITWSSIILDHSTQETDENELDNSITSIQERNMRKLHTAVRLNEMLHERSASTELIIINLPSVPTNRESQVNYMNFMEVLVEGLDRVMMIRGTGREVITMYN